MDPTIYHGTKHKVHPHSPKVSSHPSASTKPTVPSITHGAAHGYLMDKDVSVEKMSSEKRLLQERDLAFEIGKILTEAFNQHKNNKEEFVESILENDRMFEIRKIKSTNQYIDERYLGDLFDCFSGKTHQSDFLYKVDDKLIPKFIPSSVHGNDIKRFVEILTKIKDFKAFSDLTDQDREFIRTTLQNIINDPHLKDHYFTNIGEFWINFGREVLFRSSDNGKKNSNIGLRNSLFYKQLMSFPEKYKDTERKLWDTNELHYLVYKVQENLHNLYIEFPHKEYEEYYQGIYDSLMIKNKDYMNSVFKQSFPNDYEGIKKLLTTYKSSENGLFIFKNAIKNNAGFKHLANLLNDESKPFNVELAKLMKELGFEIHRKEPVVSKTPVAPPTEKVSEKASSDELLRDSIFNNGTLVTHYVVSNKPFRAKMFTGASKTPAENQKRQHELKIAYDSLRDANKIDGPIQH